MLKRGLMMGDQRCPRVPIVHNFLSIRWPKQFELSEAGATCEFKVLKNIPSTDGQLVDVMLVGLEELAWWKLGGITAEGERVPDMPSKRLVPFSTTAGTGENRRHIEKPSDRYSDLFQFKSAMHHLCRSHEGVVGGVVMERISEEG
jgi:hypothetical protein